MASILAIFILSLGMDSTDGRSPIHPQLRAWVTQLGHNRYRIRESAARQLINSGLVAIPAVRAGARSAIPEVAARCERLIPAIPEAERERKLDQLLKPAGGPVPKGLPGLDRFLVITGDSREARQLYAEMLRIHHEILESLENNPKKASELMAAFSLQLRDRASASKPAGVRQALSASKTRFFEQTEEIALFLFVRADRRFKELNDDDIDLEIPGEPGLQERVCGPKASPVVRKLFVEWYRKEKSVTMLTQASEVVVRAEMRELLPTMLNILGDEETFAEQKGSLLKDVALLGDKQLLGRIEPLLKDKSVVIKIYTEDPQGQSETLETQLGDLALLVCWKWAGQKMTDLPTAHLEDDSGPRRLCKENFFLQAAFNDEKNRQAAHDKWKKLRAGMKK